MIGRRFLGVAALFYELPLRSVFARSGRRLAFSNYRRREAVVKVGDSVRRSIDDWESREHDAAMLHACNAIDGTAKKAYPAIRGSNARFTRLLRDNYGILGPMGMPGIRCTQTRFPVPVQNPKASGGQPDLADVTYGIHRCSYGHGVELPDGFELLRDAGGPVRQTRAEIVKGASKLSDRIIFGLLEPLLCLRAVIL
jgi:hypothetical protein